MISSGKTPQKSGVKGRCNMKVRAKILVTLGVIVLCAAVGLYTYASVFTWAYRRTNWMPVKENIYLRQAEQIKIPFRPNWTCNYSVKLQLNAKTPEKLRELISAAPFSVESHVITAGQIIGSDVLGNERIPFISAADKTCYIRGEKTFKLKSGQSYQLVADVRSGSESLDELRATILVHGSNLPKGHWVPWFLSRHRVLWLIPGALCLAAAGLLANRSAGKKKS